MNITIIIYHSLNKPTKNINLLYSIHNIDKKRVYMITIYIREHSTHNQGYSFNYRANLNNYTNSNDLLEDLFEFTKTSLEANEIQTRDFQNMEEFLIIDYELDEYIDLEIGEYENLDTLIEINDRLNELSKEEITLIDCLIGNGEKFFQALEKVQNQEVMSFNGTPSEYAEEIVEEGYFGEINNALSFYIDFEKLANDLQINGDIIYENKHNIVYSY